MGRKYTGTQIKNFYECSTELGLRRNDKKFKGAKWGKLCEQVYLKTKDCSEKGTYHIVQDFINKAFPELPITDSILVIKNLSIIIVRMHSNNEEIIYTNHPISSEEFSVEIDTIISKNNSEFIREIKSYASPNEYAWNSDIMQLTIQNMVLASHYDIDFYYGEIVYLGNGKIVNINTRPYVPAIYRAIRSLERGTKKVDCEVCNFYNIPCYTQVRYQSPHLSINESIHQKL